MQEVSPSTAETKMVYQPDLVHSDDSQNLATIHQDLPGSELVGHDSDKIAGFAFASDGSPLPWAVSIAHLGTPFVIRIHGVFNLLGEMFLRERIERLTRALGVKEVTLDLTYCEFADSTGLIVILNANWYLKQAGGQLRLSHLSERTRQIFENTGLDQILAVIP